MVGNHRQGRMNQRTAYMEFLAIDLGQSGSRLRYLTGEVRSDGPAFDPVLGLVGSVERTLHALAPSPVDIVALSLTGLRGSVPDPGPLAELCNNLTGATRVCVADDGFAAHMGALGGTNGVVVCVGSGVVGVGRVGESISHRDGAGPILGDDGGGFWIGNRGLRAALQASEGRGPDTALLERVQDEYGAIRASILSRSQQEAMQWCVEVAQLVLTVADEGDGVAIGIRTAAAQLIAATALASWRAICTTGEETAVSYSGRILENVSLRDQVIDQLLKKAPFMKWHDPIGDNLHGALLLAQSPQHDAAPLMRWWNQ